jgi:hypothetical protein
MKFLQDNLIAGQYFDGVLLATDDIFYVAELDDVSIRIRKNLMGTQDQEDVLEIAKNIHRIEINDAHNKNLKTVFNYPALSGNTFDISNSNIQFYNSLQLYKATLPYPYVFSGNNGAKVTFVNSAELDTFHAAAFLEYNTVQATRLTPANNAIDLIALSGTTLELALVDLFAITY